MPVPLFTLNLYNEFNFDSICFLKFYCITISDREIEKENCHIHVSEERFYKTDIIFVHLKYQIKKKHEAQHNML